MNKNKTTYDRPTCEVLVVRFEDGILNNISNGANYSSQAGGAGGDDYYDDSDSF